MKPVIAQSAHDAKPRRVSMASLPCASRITTVRTSARQIIIPVRLNWQDEYPDCVRIWNKWNNCSRLLKEGQRHLPNSFQDDRFPVGTNDLLFTRDRKHESL